MFKQQLCEDAALKSINTEKLKIIREESQESSRDNSG